MPPINANKPPKIIKINPIKNTTILILPNNNITIAGIKVAVFNLPHIDAATTTSFFNACILNASTNISLITTIIEKNLEKK